jgi:L-threonylcarbamoyladenylate synthase
MSLPFRSAPEIEAAIPIVRDHLAGSKVLAYPTETVYGLGANGLDPAAIQRIFAAKGRPTDNPVILHVTGIDMARTLTRLWSPAAEKLADAFWPGPLTIVVPRGPDVPLEATGGLDTVAIRAPDHPVALALIDAAGVPIAAPSANRSGRPSPTRCKDAVADLGASVALYLDGGPTRIGVESTVVLLGEKPTILRFGAITREQVERLIGPVAAHTSTADKPLAPGMKYRHYSPETPLEIVTPGDLAAAWKRAKAETGKADPARGRVGWLVSSESGLSGPDVVVVASRMDAESWANRIFSLLRDVDGLGYERIVVEAIPETGLGAAVMERLRKAAQG